MDTKQHCNLSRLLVVSLSAILLLTALLPAVTAAAAASDVQSVIDLQSAEQLSNFLDQARGNYHAVIQLYDTSDGSRSFEYDYILVGSSLHRQVQGVQVARVNATAVTKAKALCKVGSAELPVVRVIPKDVAGVAEGTTYPGALKAAPVFEFIADLIGSPDLPFSSVVDLTAGNFESMVTRTARPALIEFYAPWCGFCKRVAPDYEAVAASFSQDEEKVIIAKVDCVKERGLASRFKVNGFPTIKFFPAPTANPTAKGASSSAPAARDPKNIISIDYDGARDARGFIKYINGKTGLQRELGGGLSDIFGRIKAVDELASQWFTAKTDDEAEAAQTAFMEELDQLEAAQAAAGDSDDESRALAVKALGVYRTVMERGSSDKGWLTRERTRLDNLLRGLSPRRGTYVSYKLQANIIRAFSEDWEDAWVDSYVVDLKDTDFDEKVGQGQDVLVEFYAPWCGHCQQLAPEYEKAAKELRGRRDIVVAKVDATQEKTLGERFGVKGFPTIKFFRRGSLTPVDYQGGRSASDISMYLRQQSSGAAAQSHQHQHRKQEL